MLTCTMCTTYRCYQLTDVISFQTFVQDSHIPPSERCAYKTDKKPTGPYNRKHLIDFLEKKAREEKDWDEVKPYTKEIRGIAHYIIL